jgi:UDP-glucuronate 4-epimerase
MKILVTGAAGFIGSRVSAELSIQGHEVVGVDSLNDYYSVGLKLARIENLLKPHGVTFERVNLLDEVSLNLIFQKYKPDTCIHLAAQPGVRIPRSEAGKYFDGNVQAFTNVLLCVDKHKLKNFMFASTSSVYGTGAKLPYIESETDLNPQSIYGATKLANEILAKSFLKGTGINHRAIRLFTVYGPWGRPDMAYLKLINSSLTGKPFTLYGDGTLKRDFTFIEDTTHAITKLIDELDARKEGFGDIVNVGGGKPESMNELIAVIQKITKKKAVIHQIAPLAVDPLETSADHKYLESLIGVIPTTPLGEGIQKCIEWATSLEISHELDSWLR